MYFRFESSWHHSLDDRFNFPIFSTSTKHQMETYFFKILNGGGGTDLGWGGGARTVTPLVRPCPNLAFVAMAMAIGCSGNAEE